MEQTTLPQIIFGISRDVLFFMIVIKGKESDFWLKEQSEKGKKYDLILKMEFGKHGGT